MVAPSNSPPSPGPKEEGKPRRKYTVSEKVLAANRLNLVQANAEPEKKYRPSDRRLAATYASLIKAREGKRRKRLRGQATGVKYGLAVTDLYSTLGLADATREEIDGHYQLFRDLIKPAGDEERKLARALAECSWRRSQVLHVHAVDGAMLMKARLAMASDDARRSLSARSLALLMMDVFNRRRPDLEEQLGILTRHFERLSYILLWLRSEHEGFGEKIRWGRKIHQLLRLPAEALGNPFVSGRQIEEILREKSHEIKPLDQMKWEGKDKKQEKRQEKFQKDCEQATFPSGLDEIGIHHYVDVKGTTEYVKDEGRTRAAVGQGEPRLQSVMVNGTVAVEVGLDAREWSEEEERRLVEELRRQWIETSAELRQQGKETVGGVGLEELGKALEQAFQDSGVGSVESEAAEEEAGGEEAEEAGEAKPEEEGFETQGSGFGEKGEAGDSGSGVRDSESGRTTAPPGSTGSASSPSPESGIPNPGNSRDPESQIPESDPPTLPDLREVTAAAWDRVRFLEWWSRRERREMKGILQRTGQKTRAILEALLGVFRGYKKILLEARHYEARLQDALFRFLSRLYGGDPGFSPPSPVWTDPDLYRKMMNDMREVWGN